MSIVEVPDKLPGAAQGKLPGAERADRLKVNGVKITHKVPGKQQSTELDGSPKERPIRITSNHLSKGQAEQRKAALGARSAPRGASKTRKP
jgi:hypothetical protein